MKNVKVVVYYLLDLSYNKLKIFAMIFLTQKEILQLDNTYKVNLNNEQPKQTLELGL